MREPSPVDWDRVVRVALLVLTGLAAALHVPPIFMMAITGDEFRFLADIYRFREGTLTLSLQTFHVRLLGWVTAFGSREIEEVMAGRVVYYVLLLGTSGFAYLIGRRFLSPPAALFAVLCYLGFRQVILTGTSFRFDGLSVFFIMAALVVLLYDRPRRGGLMAGAVLAAVAFLVTLKAIFYLPTFAAVVLLRNHSDPLRRRLRDLLLFGAALAAAFLALLFIHDLSLPSTSATESAGSMGRVGRTAFILDTLFPARRQLLNAVLLNAFIWLFLLLGVVSLLRRVTADTARREALLLLSLLLPLGSLVVYRNAFAYFYVFLMPAALVVAGVRFDEILRRARSGRAAAAIPFLSLMVLGVVLGFAVHYRSHLRGEMVSGEILPAQKQTVWAVHRTFPEPVPYIDGRSMIASFPKVGFFMSAWLFERYRHSGEPVFPRLVREEQPRFVLANHEALLRALEQDYPPGRYPEDRLYDEDHRALRENYVHHWGPIYVAGKRLELSGSEQSVEILIPGPYTVEGEGPVIIDGERQEPGAVVDLAPGTHRIRSAAAPQGVVLRWGRDLFEPSERPLPLWTTHGARPSALTRPST